MAESIDSEKIAEYKECFNLYDQDNDGLISPDQVLVVMRSLGQSPTVREVNRLLAKTGKTKINFPEFLELMWQFTQKPRNAEQEIYTGFQMYDKEKTGRVSVKDLKHILTRTGEKLTSEELDFMLKNLGVGKGTTHVKYADIAKLFGTV